MAGGHSEEDLNNGCDNTIGQFGSKQLAGAKLPPLLRSPCCITTCSNHLLSHMEPKTQTQNP